MSKQTFDEVIQRASSDARFKASLSDNFEGAVRTYDLTGEEKVRLANGLGMPGVASAYAMSAAAASTNELGSQELGSQELGSQELGSQELGSQELGSQELGSQSYG
jgi:hypothetical protein